MNKPIPFPSNHSNFVQRAKEFFLEGKLEQAADALKQALNIHYEKTLFLFYISLLEETKNESQALEMLEKYHPELRESDQLEPLDRQFISFLISTQKLEEAEKQILQRKENLLLLHHKENWIQVLEQQLNLAKEIKQNKREEERAILRKQSLEIEQLHFYQQIELIRNLDILSEPEFLKISSHLLCTNHLDSFLKTEILQKLHSKKIQAKISIKKNEFHQQIIPAHLIPLEETEFYLVGKKKIENKHYNPEVEKMLLQNFYFHCAYYYPFEKFALQSVEKWIQIIRTFDGSFELSTEPETNKIQKRIIAAEQSLNKLM